MDPELIQYVKNDPEILEELKQQVKIHNKKTIATQATITLEYNVKTPSEEIRRGYIYSWQEKRNSRRKI